jgi:RHS repeat-associated protein
MCYHNFIKLFSSATLIVSLAWHPQSAVAATNYTNWPAAPEWVELTNHITWCYSAITQRNEAAGAMLSTNDFAPSFIYPYWDYVRFAQAIDALAPYFVCQTNADPNGYPDFGNYFAAYIATNDDEGDFYCDFPYWRAANLHTYAFGNNDWSTNFALHSWMAVTNHDIQRQVQDAITNLIWTTYWGGRHDFTGAVVHVGLSDYGKTSFAVAQAQQSSSWSNHFFQPADLIWWGGGVYDSQAFVSDDAGSGYASSIAFASKARARPVLPAGYTGVLVSVSWYVWMHKRYIRSSTDNSTYDMFPCEDLGMATNYPVVGCYYPATDMSENPLDLYPLTGWSSWWDNGEFSWPQWLLKWQFTNAPPALTAHAVAQDPDTDRDDLSDPGVNLLSVVSDTGTIVFRPEQDQPYVVIPLASPPFWVGGSAAHAFISQGGTTNLPFQYLVPGVSDEDGPYQAYSLATRILESGTLNTDTIRIKQVSVLRPRGNTVIFEFPWDEGSNAFSSVGYPIGINASRTYVLRDATPEGDGDLQYDLIFQSGIIHQYNGGITNILQVGGLSTPVATNGFLGGLVALPFSASDAKYNVEISWQAGELGQVAYKSKDNSAAITVVVLRDGMGCITGLSKSGGIIDIAKANVAVSGNTITYAWGTATRSQDAPAGQPRTVIQTTTATGLSPVNRETKFNAQDRPYKWKTSSIVAGNSLVAETTAIYCSADGRHINGAPRNSKIQSLTLPDKSTSLFTYDGDLGYDTGWVLTETTPVSSSPFLSRTIAYDYFTAYGSDDTGANRSSMVERPRSVTVKLNSKDVARTLYSYAGAAQTIVQECITPSASWDAAGNLVTIRNIAVGGLSNGLPNSVIGPVFGSTWTYVIDGVTGCSFDDIGTLAATETRNTGVTDFQTVNAFGYITDKTVRESSAAGQPGYDTFSAHAGTPDAFGRPNRMDYKDGTWETFSDYCLWGPKSITRRDKGTTSIGAFNDFGVAASLIETAPARSITQSTDPLGLQTSVTVTEGGLVSTVVDTQDLLGRPLTHVDPLSTRSWAYADNNDGYWTITLSQAGLGPVTVKTFADGSVNKVFGSGARQCVSYALSLDESDQPALTATALDASGGTLQEAVTIACNAFGQPVSAQKSGVAQAMFFDYKPDTAIPWHITDESGVRVAFTWNNYIGIEQFGIKMDAGEELAPASHDRMFRFGTAITDVGETATASTYESNGSGIETSYASLYTSHDGKHATVGIAGKVDTVTVSDYTAPGVFAVTASSSDGTSTHKTYAPSGQILSMDSMDAQSGTNKHVTVSLAETQNGRIYTISDSSAGTEVLSFDTADRLVSDNAAASGGQNTTIGYLAGTDLPTLIAGGGKTWSCQYHPNGLPSVVSVSGSPTANYGWDTQGRLHTMTVDKSSSQSCTTTWNRDSQTGRLTSKTVNGVTVESYAWRPNGQPDTITRPSGIVTYQYNAGGDCTAMVETPTGGSAETVLLAKNRMGQAASSSIANGVSESYARRVDGSLSGVQVSGGIVPSYTLDLPRDATTGRATGFSLTSVGQTRTATVAYNAASLVASVADGAVSAEYAYTPGKKASSVHIKLNGMTCMVLSNGWNEALGLRSNMTWIVGGTVISRSDMQRGPGTGQISRIVREDGSIREASYESNGMLSKWTYLDAEGVADYDRCWRYSYDGAGNLVAAGHDSSVPGCPAQMSPMATEYATRNIRAMSEFNSDDYNFHTLRKWNAVDLVFYAATNAHITVDGMRARQNESRFVVSIPLATSAVARITNLVVCSVVSVGTNLEYYTTNAIQVTLPAYPETIETALGSAVTSDSVRELLYDSRGQLRRVTDKAGTTAARLQSTYDYYPDGRRARKTVTVWNGSAWQPYRSCQFVYDQWNLVREVVSNATGVITRDYAWGLDLNGLQDGQWGQAAGGIGGLLAITEVSGTCTNILLPICDHVGTVHALVAVVTNNVTLTVPAIVATYEYTPYGDLIAVDGPFVASCPFGFQTKYRDSETGLIYFGYRFYEPRTGKWMTTDPLGEAGGLNLTAAFGNNPVNNIDPLGLAEYNVASLNMPGVNPIYYMTAGDFWNPSASSELGLNETQVGLRVTGLGAGFAVTVGASVGLAYAAPVVIGAAGTAYATVGATAQVALDTQLATWLSGAGLVALTAEGVRNPEFARQVIMTDGGAAFGEAAAGVKTLARRSGSMIKSAAAERTLLDWHAVVPVKGPYKGQIRTDHVRLHNLDIPTKPAHGVFYGDGVDLTNEAWFRAQQLGLKADTTGTLRVPMGRIVGRAGGQAADSGELFYTVEIKVVPNSNKLITSYPTN